MNAIHTAMLVPIAMAVVTGCRAGSERSSSTSIDNAKSRAVLTAEFAIPANAVLGRYRVIEVWIEEGRKLVVRLDGPHVDTEPRVQVHGRTTQDYLHMWSEQSRGLYEVWLAPLPVPDSLILERDSQTLEVRRRP